MDAITTHYNQFHPEAEIFSVSLTTLLAVTGDGSHLEQRGLGARFWIFIRSNVQADQSSNHFWISIVDRVKGHFFSHNNLRDVCDPSILFGVLTPIFESPRVQNVAGSAPTLALPANTVVDVPQQQNGYDCSVYSVKTITGKLVLDGIPRGSSPFLSGKPVFSQQLGLRKINSEVGSRLGLCWKPVCTSATPNLLNNVLTALSDANHHHDVGRAMWHLDNAGGILLQLNYLPVDNFPPGCLCQNQDNGCGLSVVPVPPGYQVVLMSDSILSRASWARVQDLPVLRPYLPAY
ncbi:hypothetical protein HOY80DRAFT_1061283 [Tuber brumale]|nr:hypothetical protein HOY80DRAFT_1061283 [Tuber brumale]